MPSVKELFPTTDSFYQAFLESEYGQKTYQEAYSLYPKYNNGGFHTDQAVDYIYEQMNSWLYQYIPELNEIEIEAFLDTHIDSLQEEIIGGLT
jgi:hypothetical protein